VGMASVEKPFSHEYTRINTNKKQESKSQNVLFIEVLLPIFFFSFYFDFDFDSC
jgi:hypothetical protein